MIIPEGLKEIEAYYGIPDRDDDFVPDQVFLDRNLVKKRLPFPLRISWNQNLVSLNIYAHRLAIDQMIKYYDELAGMYGGYNQLKQEGLDIWGGAYQFRAKKGGEDLSTHCWGISFDPHPLLGPFGEKSKVPYEIVTMAEELGFENGGHWEVPDGMHFQLCKEY